MIRPALLIRPSEPRDVAAITAIYDWNVRHGTGTFELDAPDEAEMARRRDDVLAKGLPWLVAERRGRVVGYAYANHFRPRPRLPLLPRGFDLPRPRRAGAGRGPACCWPN